ncbi:hypothetical protein GGR57DRAFT_481421 [Xylariaceae sp. FL1272]|nr:hypothetical protein GGR57DRAFT_481421 [Xylariaceae sp. FL1272]
MLPMGHTGGSRPSLTILGVAAHLMAPFAGVGVNVAFRGCTRACSSRNRMCWFGCRNVQIVKVWLVCYSSMNKACISARERASAILRRLWTLDSRE